MLLDFIIRAKLKVLKYIKKNEANMKKDVKNVVVYSRKSLIKIHKYIYTRI